MPLRKWLLSSVLWGGIIAVPAVASAVEAGGSHLLPQSNWAVSKISATRLGGGSYCALARRFDDNLVLTFARNKSDEGSVAIDFQRKAIDQTQAYNVVLNPGYGKERTFSVEPVSERALVIKLGRDYSFYDALGRSGLLKVEFGEHAYSFSMADIRAGEGELNSCLKSLEAPEVTKEAEAEPLLPAAPTDEKVASAKVAPVMKQVDDRALRDLKEENVRLRNALERERRVFEERFMNETADSSSVNELRERLAILKTENEKLRETAEVTSEPAACYAEVTDFDIEADPLFLKLKEENAQLKAEIKKLQQEVETLAKVARSTGDRESLIGDLQQQVKALEVSNVKENKALVTKLQEEIANTTDHARKVEEDLAVARKEALVAQQKLTISEQRIETLKAEAAELQAQAGMMSNTDKKLSAIKQEAETAENRAREAEEKLALAEREVISLRKQVQQSQAKIEAKTSEAQQISDLRMQLEQTELRALQNLEKFVSAKHDVDRLNSEVDSLRMEIAGDSNQARVTELEAKLREAQRKALVAEEKLASAEREIEDLRVSAVAVSRKGHSTDEVNRLLHRIADLEAENQDLIANLEPAAGAGSMTPMPGNEGTFALIKNLEAELAAVKQERDRFAKQIEISQSTVEENLIKIATDNWDLETATRRFNEAEREMRRLGMEIDRERNRCAKEKRELEYMLFDPRIASDAQMAKLEQLENEIIAKDAALVVQKEKFEEKIAGLQGAVQTLETKLQTASLRKDLVGGLSGDIVARKAESMATISPAAGNAAAHGKSYLPLPVEVHALDAGKFKAAGFTNKPASNENNSFIDEAGVKALIAGTGARISNLKEVNFGGSSKAFTWEAGKLFGSAEQKQMSPDSSFAEMAGEYIERTRLRCEGEFAAIPILEDVAGGRQIGSYEIACVGSDGNSASASILFTAEDGLFTIIAHEADVSSMDEAMDIRDKLAEQFRGVIKAAQL